MGPGTGVRAGVRTKVRIAAIIAFILGISILIAGCQLNRAPVADAGDKMTAQLTDIIYLNGSMSHDPDGDQLEYQWVFSIVPDGSSPFLDDASSAYASFQADMPGTYILELRVFDGELYSGRDHVLIKVNSDLSIIVPPDFPPRTPINSQVGLPEYYTTLGKETFVQGSINNPSVIIEWNILSRPEDAVVRLDRSNPDGVNFSTNKIGYYLLQEIVRHSGGEIGDKLIGIQVVEKIVDAGPDRFSNPDSIAYLSFSYFAPLPPVDALVKWSIKDMPALSDAKIGDSESINAAFIPDIEGDYEISVLVILPNGEQNEDTIIITVSDEFASMFDHATISGNCVNCHDGINTIGKSASHVTSTESCASCHSTRSFVPAIIIDHSQLIGSCTDCHNGVVATGKNVSHINSSDSCSSCHSTDIFVPVITVDHSEAIGTCKSCHNGLVSIGASSAHIRTTDLCEACHSTNGFFPIIVVDHQEVIGECENCHNNIVAPGVTSSHVATLLTCDECHTTTTWTPVLQDNNVVIMPDGLDISIVESTSTFQIGELIKVTAMFSNNSDKDIELYISSVNANPLQIEVSGMNLDTLVLSNPNDLPTVSGEAGISLLKAGESIVREVVWDQVRFDDIGLTPEGNYTLEAFVLALEPGTIKQQLIGIKNDIVIKHPATLIDINTAVITALEDPVVKVWYETLSQNIACDLNDQVTLVKDYKITPIQTLVEVAAEKVQCHALLIDATNPMWSVYFQNSNIIGDFTYHVSIDATSGELKMSMPM